MTKKEWLTSALSSLEFFATNPEYKGEFGHQYFIDNYKVSRQTLYRNDLYMKRYREVKELLKNYNTIGSKTGPSVTSGDDKEEISALNAKLEALQKTINELQLRLNDCYQMLEDHGIDPEFVYPRRLKKHREA
jgi:hypothetical protein